MSVIVATPIVDTVPKYVAITPNRCLPRIQPAGGIRDVSPNSSCGYASSDNCNAVKPKKRRLDHLTWEEKIQRKKLKNRVAAQTSRDRKKARMEEMENEIKDLTEKTEILQNKCDSLMTINNSLLEKNQALDMEVNSLRQQLLDIQEQQKNNEQAMARITSCVNCASMAPNGSAAGITKNGDQRHTTEATDSSAMEDCSALPALQDMLLFHDIQDVSEEDFDASRLEELAETLLADITADLEASNRASNENVAKVSGSTERLPEPVVGTTTECMESSRHTHDHTTKDSGINLPTITATAKITEPADINDSSVESNIVYGTYDASTNSITIVLDDDSEPVQEAVEEIDGCENEIQPVIKMESDDSDFEDISNFDPISKFLKPKQHNYNNSSPVLSSTSSTYSSHDHGYESIMGSPTNSISTTSIEPFITDIGTDDFAEFNDLFPNLI